MKFEEIIHVDTSPEKIFALYKDVNSWPAWDPETKQSSIDDEFIAGTLGFIKPKSGPKSKFTITEVVQNKLFTLHIQLPFCNLCFEHELKPKSSGTEVLHRITFRGFLAPILGKLIGNRLKKEQSRSMKALKKEAEKNRGSVRPGKVVNSCG